MNDSLTIAVMARAPVPGRCKTRLAAAIGAEGAARLYAAMLTDRLAAIDALSADRRVLLAAPEDDGVATLRRWAPKHWDVIPQEGADLGARLANAFAALLGRGLVCVVDSDSPAVSLAEVSTSLAASTGHEDVVLGPCEDGGYYLVGMRAPHLCVFDAIPWSTARVMEATRQRAGDLGLHARELSVGWDVDDARDLERLRSDALVNAPRTMAVLREIDGVLLR